jgi:NADPH:quinone reductase-like Zn-dependent oxidoreductase
MKAIIITKPGAPDVLQLRDYPTPTPGDEEVLIEVKAAGLNRADISQRQGITRRHRRAGGYPGA